jgi:hypothetical protein
VKSADGEVRIMWSSTRLDMEGFFTLDSKPFCAGSATNRDKKGGNEVHANVKTEAESVETDPDALKQETDVSITLQVQFPEQCLKTYALVEYDGRPYPGYVEDVDAAW